MMKARLFAAAAFSLGIPSVAHAEWTPVQGRLVACVLSAAGHHIQDTGSRDGLARAISAVCSGQYQQVVAAHGRADAEALLATALMFVGRGK